VRAILTTRDGMTPRRRHAARIAIVAVVAAACGCVHAGASWGSSAYSPASDPYSMQNVTQADGVQSWWNAGYTGKGVDVALIDTGVAPVPGLSTQSKIVNGPDLTPESQNPKLQYLDTNGHGTFMAGIIGGNDGQPGGYRGVAPDSRILSVKVGSANGAVDVSQVIAAIDWVVQHRYDNGMNIRVINLSYGTSSSQSFLIDPLAYAAEQAWKDGIVVVTAAGNDGVGSGLLDPAYDPWLIAVGAADTMGTPTMADDQPTGFSSGASCSGWTRRCRTPDLLAPGAHMQGLRDPGSYVDQNNPSAVLGTQYFRGSGTSEAAAYVTGAVALLLQRYPQLTPNQVKQMLIESSDSLPGYSTLEQGHGELDMNALLSDSVPQNARQFHLFSLGSGSLEASRGSSHLSLNGVLLQGEQDIFGQPFNSVKMAVLEANGSSWSGGTWNGSQWTGNSWSGSSWSGSSWSGSTWSGNSWSGSSWSSLVWSGNSWSGSSWSGNSWSGNSWSGSSWSGNSWSGESWLGASWG